MNTSAAPPRRWAFWRRAQYIAGIVFVLLLIGTGIYFAYFYEAANCFDGTQNGDERGVDCGGSCADSREQPAATEDARTIVTMPARQQRAERTWRREGW